MSTKSISNLEARLAQPKATGYVGVNGNVTNYAGKVLPGISAAAGGRVNLSGLIFDVDGQIGSNWGVDANMGYKFDFKNDMGLELTAGSSIQQEFGTQKGFVDNKVSFNDEVVIDEHKKYESKFSDIRYKAAAKYTYEPSWGSIKVGVEGGYRTATGLLEQSKVVDNFRVDNNMVFYDRGILVSQGYEGAYITPTFEAKVNLGKGLSAIANADFYNGNVGIRYNF